MTSLNGTDVCRKYFVCRCICAENWLSFIIYFVVMLPKGRRTPIQRLASKITLSDSCKADPNIDVCIDLDR